MGGSGGGYSFPVAVTRRLAPCLISVAIATCAVLAGAAGAGTRTAHAGRPSLQRQLTALVRMPGGPPAAIAIVQRGGRRIVYRAGVTAVGRPGRVSPRDHMRLASTSKAFSGAVALGLVDRHVLSLSDTIAKWLPQLPAAWGSVTLAELLDHTGGVPDFTQDRGFRAYIADHLHATPTPLFLLHFVAHKDLEFDAGTEYRYSNSDNFVVALMAEAASHHSYDRLLSSLVYRPLHLTHTSLPSGSGMPSPYLHGYSIDPPKPPEDLTMVVSAAYAWASGGLVSTPADLNAFIRGYAGGRLFGGTARARQLRFIPGNSEPIGPGTNSVGLGIFRYRTPCGTVYGHTGNTFGYTQFMAATRNGRRSVTVSVSEQITNRSTGPQLAAFKQLRQVETRAVCAALS